MGSIVARGWRGHLGWVGGIAGAVLVVLLGIAAAAGFFAADAVRVYPAAGRARSVGVLYMSGDMGLRFGPNPHTTAGLAAQGIGVVGLNAPTLFRTRRTRIEVDRIVADGIAQALARTGAERLVVIGQSYGADILATGLAHLPASLRPRVAGVVLIVPGETVFFRADPSGLVYRGRPDADGVASPSALGWTRLTCIYGREETDSACPGVHLRLPGARLIAMPGGHFLDDDYAGLLGHVLDAIRRAAPAAFR